MMWTAGVSSPASSRAARARIRSLARRKRLLVLMASTEAALVRMAGAPMSESRAKGLETRGESGLIGMPKKRPVPLLEAPAAPTKEMFLRQTFQDSESAFALAFEIEQ